MSHGTVKILFLFGLFLIAGALHAQQPGVDCAPIQGQGWSGCAPINPSQPSAQGQQPQVPQAPPERWQDHWGAIATDAARGVLGTAANMPNELSAKQAALSDCMSKGGSNCVLEIQPYRNSCGVLVTSGTSHVVTSNTSLDQAIQEGMKTCTKTSHANCRVYYSACSLPVRTQ